MGNNFYFLFTVFVNKEKSYQDIVHTLLSNIQNINNINENIVDVMFSIAINRIDTDINKVLLFSRKLLCC